MEVRVSRVWPRDRALHAHRASHRGFPSGTLESLLEVGSVLEVVQGLFAAVITSCSGPGQQAQDRSFLVDLVMCGFPIQMKVRLNPVKAANLLCVIGLSLGLGLTSYFFYKAFNRPPPARRPSIEHQQNKRKHDGEDNSENATAEEDVVSADSMGCIWSQPLEEITAPLGPGCAIKHRVVTPIETQYHDGLMCDYSRLYDLEYTTATPQPTPNHHPHHSLTGCAENAKQTSAGQTVYQSNGIHPSHAPGQVVSDSHDVTPNPLDNFEKPAYIDDIVALSYNHSGYSNDDDRSDIDNTANALVNGERPADVTLIGHVSPCETVPVTVLNSSSVTSSPEQSSLACAEAVCLDCTESDLMFSNNAKEAPDSSVTSLTSLNGTSTPHLPDCNANSKLLEDSFIIDQSNFSDIELDAEVEADKLIATDLSPLLSDVHCSDADQSHNEILTISGEDHTFHDDAGVDPPHSMDTSSTVKVLENTQNDPGETLLVLPCSHTASDNCSPSSQNKATSHADASSVIECNDIESDSGNREGSWLGDSNAQHCENTKADCKSDLNNLCQWYNTENKLADSGFVSISTGDDVGHVCGEEGGSQGSGASPSDIDNAQGELSPMVADCLVAKDDESVRLTADSFCDTDDNALTEDCLNGHNAFSINDAEHDDVLLEVNDTHEGPVINILPSSYEECSPLQGRTCSISSEREPISHDEPISSCTKSTLDSNTIGQCTCMEGGNCSLCCKELTESFGDDHSSVHLNPAILSHQQSSGGVSINKRNLFSPSNSLDSSSAFMDTPLFTPPHSSPSHTFSPHVVHLLEEDRYSPVMSRRSNNQSPTSSITSYDVDLMAAATEIPSEDIASFSTVDKLMSLEKEVDSIKGELGDIACTVDQFDRVDVEAYNFNIEGLKKLSRAVGNYGNISMTKREVARAFDIVRRYRYAHGELGSPGMRPSRDTARLSYARSGSASRHSGHLDRVLSMSCIVDDEKAASDDEYITSSLSSGKPAVLSRSLPRYNDGTGELARFRRFSTEGMCNNTSLSISNDKNVHDLDFTQGEAAIEPASKGVIFVKDILTYSEREWKSDTKKAVAIRQGYNSLVEDHQFQWICKIRGDNYCGIRSTLCSMILQGVHLEKSKISEAVEKLDQLFADGRYDFLEQWTKGSGSSDEESPESLDIMKSCLQHLDQQITGLTTCQGKEQVEQQLASIFNTSEGDYALMEGVKVLMMIKAIELQQVAESGADVPVFAMLMHARDTSETIEQLFRNHLQPAGRSSGLEQVEMCLMGYTLGVTLQVFRLSQHGNPDFVACYPDDGVGPLIPLVAEDDRHYNTVY